MTDRATTNPVQQTGSDSAMSPSTDIDNPENLNFWEPTVEEEDEKANPGNSAEGIAGETDEDAQDADQEAGESAETEEQDADEAEAEKQAAKEATDEDILVTLKGGEQVPIKELKLGYMRERDYRVKTSEVANKSRSLEELSNRVTNTATAIAEFLISQMPPEPSQALAMQNPGEFVRQKAIFDAAAMRVNQILAKANEPKAVTQQLTKDQKDELLRTESAKLAERFPQTATSEGRETFFEQAFDTARDLGFTDEEFRDVTDHRYFMLAHYARLGMQAEQAKKKAIQKVSAAPAPTPKPKAQGANVQQARKNQDAMQRLGKTGSMKDALNIDFE